MKKPELRTGPLVERVNDSFQERVYSDGFTLVELLVVLAVIAVLTAILLPAFGQSQSNSQSFQCLENTRRLTLAWRMYAEDNSDLLVYSSDDGTGPGPYQATVPAGQHQANQYAWTWSKMDFSGDNPYNWDPNADIKLRPLWQYVKDAAVYKCPADASQVTLGSLPLGYTGPYTVGSVVPRIRSYSMNFYLGGFAGNNQVGPVGGSAWAAHFPVYLKLTDLNNSRNSPAPNQTFVFVGERSDCINWGNFETDFSGYPLTVGARTVSSEYEWTEDLPASYHNLAAGISFADGHSEMHRWLNPNTYPPLAVGTLEGGGSRGDVFLAPYSQDVAWMQNVTARPH